MDIRTRAFQLYEAPFKFICGYIQDAKNRTVADDGDMDDRIARVRGWGRIGYLEEPEKLQDEIGSMIAEALTQYWSGTIQKLQADNLQQAERIRKFEREAENYRSVMIAAAEEIHEYWDAHCDEEGYGPANLMYRLENGIPAEYGYKVGTFNKMQSRIDGLEHQLAEKEVLINELVEYAVKLKECVDIAILHYAEVGSEHWNKFDTAPTLPLPKAMR